MTNNNKKSGFSLFEMLIVLSIICLLALIAIPTYQNFLRQSFRQQVQIELLALIINAQNYHDQHNNYIGMDLQLTGPISTHYQLKFTEQSDNTYTLSAIPLGNQQRDRCGTLRINQMGITEADAANCWI